MPQKAINAALDLDGLEVLGVATQGQLIEVVVESRFGTGSCRSCGGIAAEPKERPEVLIRDLPMCGRAVVLRWRKRRWRCTYCSKTWTEAHPQVPPRARMTLRFRQHLATRAAAQGNPSQVAGSERVSYVAFGFGALSVHEVAVDPVEQGLAYLSYYSGGLRVIRYGDNGIREVGHYIHKDGNDFWGVETHFLPDSNKKLILASDRDSGLWIFRFTGRTDKRFERFVVRKANLNGAKEVPGPGDPDGKGAARIRLHANRGEVCYQVSWDKIGSPFAAHVHEGRSDVAGPVVVTLFQEEQPLPDKPRRRSDCIEGVDRALVADIVKSPRDYYVNDHNPEFPAGAIRGQLFNP